MRILVFGANGFLGSHTCRALLRHGHLPVAACRATADLWRLHSLASDVEILRTGVTDRDSVTNAIARLGKVDGLVNCIAYGVEYSEQDPVLAYKVNVAAPMTIALAARELGITMVHIGTAYEYGDWSGPLTETTPLMPRGIYGQTKAAATLCLTPFAESTGAAIRILRMFSLYGPFEGGKKLIPAVLRADRTGEQIELTPGGQIRDYLYVEDAADAICHALVRCAMRPGEIVNICSGKAVTLRDVVTAAVPHSASLAWGAKAYRFGEMMSVVGDPHKAACVLDWRPTTPIEQGMSETRKSETLRPTGK